MLKSRHIEDCLELANKYQHKSDDFWSDEAKIEIFIRNMHIRVWMKKGT